MKIYTKTGDSGETSLFGGSRVWKDDLRIESYGTVDELNSMIGLAIEECDIIEIKIHLVEIQADLFNLGADLASPLGDKNNSWVPRISENDCEKLEKLIDETDSELPKLKNFILPGGSKFSAMVHIARTVCRRGERQVVKLERTGNINHIIVVYLNRLSDYLFVLARYYNHKQGKSENIWSPRKK